MRATRTGRTAAANISFYLSIDHQRDRGDVHLAGDARVSGGATRALSIAARPQIPAGQALGAYHLIACIRASCRAANAPLQVGATPVGTRELVAAAVAAHRLTPQQGLVYRVFAALGDPRLPAAYRDDESEPEELVMRDVVSQWATLSPSQKATLLPYFTPPAAKQSAWAPRTGRAASVRPLPLVQPACDTNQAVGKDWLTIAKPGGHVRIWWLKDNDKQVGPRARSLLTDVENYIWPRLVAIFGREPLRDGHERCFHGIDDKLDIYMWGLPHARAMTFAYPPDCSASPAYIVFDSRSSLPTRWEVAHELTHAFQFSYDYEGPCSSYTNWDEATATWAAAWLYPHDDDEHVFRWLLRDPDQSLADASYEGWVFAYAMAQLHGPGTIASIYAQTERQPDVLHAIDTGVPGGLKQAWPEFAKVAWNQDPVEPNFTQWDNFTQHPEQDGHEIATEQVDAAPSGQTEVDVPLGLQSPHSRLPPPEVRARRHRGHGVDPQQPQPPRRGAAQVPRRDAPRPKTGPIARLAMFCPQTTGQRLDEAVLVISNTSQTQTLPADPPLKVVATNLGCSRYTGTVSGNEHVHTPSINTTETWNATGLVYERDPSGQDNPGILFKLVGGSVTWSIRGTNQGCDISAGPVTLPVKTDGSAGILSIESWIGQGPIRTYDAWGNYLPTVAGTAKCPSGTYTWHFTPHQFLETGDPFHRPNVPTSGILDGSWVSDEHSGNARDVTYNFHLEPDR